MILNETYYQKLMQDITGDQRKAVAAELLFHIGANRSIVKEQLLYNLNYVIETHNWIIRNDEDNPNDEKEIPLLHERQLRKIISDLRLNGWLICAIASGDGGYYLAENLQDVIMFVENEYDAKIKSLKISRSVVIANAKMVFGEAYQPKLIEDI